MRKTIRQIEVSVTATKEILKDSQTKRKIIIFRSLILTVLNIHYSTSAVSLTVLINVLHYTDEISNVPRTQTGRYHFYIPPVGKAIEKK